MAWYRVGTVTTTQGETWITSSLDVAWSINVQPGDAFTIDGNKIYEIASLDEATPNTKLYLTTPYLEASITGANYAILKMSSFEFNSLTMAQKMSEVVNKWLGRDDEIRKWQTGSEFGGYHANGDPSLTTTSPVYNDPLAGYYPLTNPFSVVQYMACPAKQAALGKGQGVIKATAFLRLVSQPDTPTGGTFTSPTPTSLPTWSDGIPDSNVDLPLWCSTRIFTDNGLTPHQTVWTAPQKIGVPSKSSRSMFSVDGTTLWHTDPVTNDCYMGTQISSDNGVTWGNGTTTNAVIGSVRIKGEVGIDGFNTVKIYLYQRFTTTPTRPSANITYTFADGSMIGINNDWLTYIPTGTNTLYVTEAVAISRDATASITATTGWSIPATLSANPGANGTDGFNAATITLFQRTATSTPVPGGLTVNLIYTFADGSISGSLDNWSRTLPQTGGAYVWIITATAAARTATYTIPYIGAGMWATPALLAQDGTNPFTTELNNSHAGIPTLADGTGYTLPGLAITTITARTGSTVEAVGNCTYTATPSNCTGSFGSGATANVYTLATIAGDFGYVDITATKTGVGASNCRFTWAKNKQGITGTSATIHWVTLSSRSVAKSIAGVFTPASVTATAKTKIGSGIDSDYSGYWTTVESTDGSTEISASNPVGPTTTASRTPSPTTKWMKFKLYSDSLRTILLDTETVSIVVDGATGATGPALVLNATRQTFSCINDNGAITQDASQVNITFNVIIVAPDTDVTWSATNAAGTVITLANILTTGVKSATMTQAQFFSQNTTAVVITATANVTTTLIGKLTITRLDRSTAAAGADVTSAALPSIPVITFPSGVRNNAITVNATTGILENVGTSNIKVDNGKVTITTTPTGLTLNGAGAGEVAYNTITANTVTAANVNACAISAASITTGTLGAAVVYGGTVIADKISIPNTASGNIKLGKTAFSDNANTGFWLGNDAGVGKLKIGSPSNYFSFDGTNVAIAGSLTILPGSTGIANLGYTGALNADVTSSAISSVPNANFPLSVRNDQNTKSSLGLNYQDGANQTYVDVIGNIQGVSSGAGNSVANNIDGIIRNPGGGLHTVALNVAYGAIRVVLPCAESTMIKFTVDIYEYVTGYSCKFDIGGHTSGVAWYNESAKVLGGSNVEYPVYFGWYGGLPAIWIGTSGETWSYPVVAVKDVMAGYANFAASQWSTGWSITFDSAAPTGVTRTITDTLPGADWSKTARIPSNIAAAGTHGGTILNSDQKLLDIKDASNNTVFAITPTGAASSTPFYAPMIQAGTVKADWVYAGTINADNITSGTITGRTMQTASGSGKRIVLSNTTNDLQGYAELTPGTVAKVVDIGYQLQTTVILDNFDSNTWTATAGTITHGAYGESGNGYLFSCIAGPTVLGKTFSSELVEGVVSLRYKITTGTYTATQIVITYACNPSGAAGTGGNTVIPIVRNGLWNTASFIVSGEMSSSFRHISIVIVANGPVNCYVDSLTMVPMDPIVKIGNMETYNSVSGIKGTSYSASGLTGLSYTGAGILAQSQNGYGSVSRSYGNHAIFGYSYLAYGALISSNAWHGVFGSTNGSGYAGIYGYSTIGYGVSGSGATWDFYAEGDTAGYNVFGAGSYGPFTGAHDGLVFVDEVMDINNIGDIIADAEIVWHKNISNTIARVTYSDRPKQKNIIGVFINRRPLTPEDKGTSVPYPWSEDYSLLYDAVIFNAVGEGQINVCKEGGNIEAGDYICSSSRIGKGMKQDDDLLHNYTVAKSRESVIWAEGEDDIRMAACTYHCG